MVGGSCFFLKLFLLFSFSQSFVILLGGRAAISCVIGAPLPSSPPTSPLFITYFIDRWHKKNITKKHLLTLHAIFIFVFTWSYDMMINYNMVAISCSISWFFCFPTLFLEWRQIGASLETIVHRTEVLIKNGGGTFW